ncbi:MAG: hypothetical protein JWQ09_1090 [Segetibacter sp.]|nr:hypothetical protein [Segetibacter sp.]
MTIEIHSSFVKASKKLPADIQQKIAHIIEEIENAKTNQGDWEL